MLYLVSCILHEPHNGYDKMDDAVRQLGGVRILSSQWAVERSESAADVWKSLVNVTNPSDTLLVSELTSNMTWGRGQLMVSDPVMEAMRGRARG